MRATISAAKPASKGNSSASAGVTLRKSPDSSKPGMTAPNYRLNFSSLGVRQEQQPTPRVRMGLANDKHEKPTDPLSARIVQGIPVPGGTGGVSGRVAPVCSERTAQQASPVGGGGRAAPRGSQDRASAQTDESKVSTQLSLAASGLPGANLSIVRLQGAAIASRLMRRMEAGSLTATEPPSGQRTLRANTATGHPLADSAGLPVRLKSGIESLSGISMDNVKVRYNSSRPAQLNALAYTQGSDIHVAPGQEQHLPHEAWHAVQQVQGRVRPTLEMKGGVPVNDDEGLEHEADLMGAKALARGAHRQHAPRDQERLQGWLVSPPGPGRSQMPSQVMDAPPASTTSVSVSGSGRRLALSSFHGHLPPGDVVQRQDSDDEDEEPLISDDEEKAQKKTEKKSFLGRLFGKKSGKGKKPDSSKYQNLPDEAEAIGQRAKEIEKGRYGKSVSEPGKSASVGDKVKKFGQRAAKEMYVSPSGIGEGERAYSDTGRALRGLDTAKSVGDVLLQPALTPVESSVSALVGAAVGTNRREGRTPGTAAKAEEKIGQALSVLGDALQMVPVVGAAGGAFSAAGTVLEEHSAGATKKQALARGAAAGAAGAAAGFIPGYGTYSGFVALINDVRKLASTVERHGDAQYAHQLLARINALEALEEEAKSIDDPDEIAKLGNAMNNIHHQIDKARERYDKEIRRREKQGRGQEGAKTGLLEEHKYGQFQGGDESEEEAWDI